ncbi:hypothetical protein A8924_1177 [Saccharopolyspora erythraea NRRL 2338]|uniref:Uncharacterized protein n=2 Tax=Saccharopolyspora erythraea TaxID=1836 RepID=A4F7U5_SACEN|nr:hypothetical protein A8924_1177 [Saccharopolyspora erythraea NRRL 2338]CAM00119.1 hypothetical protein SACE_0778 [Saccharopolyspora erythraea NRRL 2338]
MGNVAPRSLFDIPWVGMRMPYNAHLMSKAVWLLVALGAAVAIPRGAPGAHRARTS